jgi:hypothetical protein
MRWNGEPEMRVLGRLARMRGGRPRWPNRWGGAGRRPAARDLGGGARGNWLGGKRERERVREGAAMLGLFR